MKELDPAVFYAVFLEMMGPLFWILIAVALAALGSFAYVLLRERSLDSGRLLRSEIAGFFGGFVALAIMAWVTVSGFTDAGGPIDWILIAIVWTVGAVGVAVIAYVFQALVMSKPKDAAA